MEIIELAKTLGEAIAQSAEFKRYKDAELAFDRDAVAQALIEQYQKKQGELSARLGKEGITPSEMVEIRRKISREFATLRENAVIAEYLDSKNAAEKLLAEVNSVIRFCVTGEEEQSESGCSGNCGSCGGCH